MHLDRNDATKRIRTALKKRSGKTWSVTGGRGTAWGWITVQAPPNRRVSHADNPEYDPYELAQAVLPYVDVQPKEGEQGYYTSIPECKELGRLFGLDRPVHCQGMSIPPDERDFWVGRAEKGQAS